jgi:hypothetical protein
VRTLGASSTYGGPVVMFWMIAAAVVVLFAVFAWWSSGRAKPFREYQRGVDVVGAEGKSRSQVTQSNASGPRNR